MPPRILPMLTAAVLAAAVLGFGKSSDPDTLAAVGQAVAGQVNNALPDRSRLAGPLTAFKPTDRFPVEEQVRARIHSDKLMAGSAVDVSGGGRPGEVRLRGRVPTAAQRLRAGQLAGETVGIDAVVNELAAGE